MKMILPASRRGGRGELNQHRPRPSSHPRQGGTSCDVSIARNRPDRGDLRRAESGGQCRVDPGGHFGGAARSRTPDQWLGRPLRTGRWCAARSQGPHPGARHGGRCQSHRPCRHAPGRSDPGRSSPPGDGTLDARHLPSGLHLRSCPPARSGAGGCAVPGLVARGRAGQDRMVVDLDSTICEVCGKAKQGAGYGYTKRLGYHPLLATLAATGEVLHVRMRKGAANTQRGTKRFIEELVARLRKAGATGELIMRFDSGFWSNATIATLEHLDVGYTLGVRMVKSVVNAVSAISSGSWTPIEYTPDGEAEVSKCIYKGRRLIVRRTRLVGRQATLWPEWRHFAFVTDLAGDPVDVDAFHRAHATVELAIKDLKEGAGMEHVPSGNFNANAAWLVCAALAHNLIRWTCRTPISRSRPSVPNGGRLR